MYLGAEVGVLVEVAAEEGAVLARGDHTLALDAEAARPPPDLTVHVPVLLALRRPHRLLANLHQNGKGYKGVSTQETNCQTISSICP